MKKINFLYLLVLISSCSTNKKVQTIKQNIQQQQLNMSSLIKKADSINNKRLIKLEAGQLDEDTDSITHYYITQLKDSVNINLKQLNEILITKRLRKKIKKVNQIINNTTNIYAQGLENVIFLDDLFSIETFSRLNTATFFGPGQYNLEDSASKLMAVMMSEIISKAVSFSNKYPLKKLKAMFIVLGYADEQSISTDGELYNELTRNMTIENPDRKQLNAELSKLRATSIKNVLLNEYNLYTKNNLTTNFSAHFIAT